MDSEAAAGILFIIRLASFFSEEHSQAKRTHTRTQTHTRTRARMRAHTHTHTHTLLRLVLWIGGLTSSSDVSRIKTDVHVVLLCTVCCCARCAVVHGVRLCTVHSLSPTHLAAGLLPSAVLVSTGAYGSRKCYFSHLFSLFDLWISFVVCCSFCTVMHQKKGDSFSM